MDIVFIIILIATSVIAVTFIIERGLALRWHKVIPPALVRVVQNYRTSEDLDQLRRTCDYYPATVSRLLRFASDHLDWSKTENVDVLQTRARHEVAKLERGLVVLEIIVGIAPLMGLVGTIYGMILLFRGMGQRGVDSAAFAQGISLALNATLLGLLIAIPSLIAWSYYTKKVENLAVEMESLCDEFLRKHYRSTEGLAAVTALSPPPTPATHLTTSPNPAAATDAPVAFRSTRARKSH